MKAKGGSSLCFGLVSSITLRTLTVSPGKRRRIAARILLATTGE